MLGPQCAARLFSKAHAGPHQAPVCDPDLGFSPPAPPQGNQQPGWRPSPPTHHQRAHQNGIRLQTREAQLCQGRGTQKDLSEVRVEGADRKEQGKTGTLIPSDSGPGPGEPWASPASPCPRELQPWGLAWSLLRRKPFGEALAAMPCDTLTGPTSLRDREPAQPPPHTRANVSSWALAGHLKTMIFHSSHDSYFSNSLPLFDPRKGRGKMPLWGAGSQHLGGSRGGEQGSSKCPG